MSGKITEGPFKGLRRNHYRAILLDPAWTFSVRSDNGKGRSPEAHYECMSIEDIMALPVQELAAKDCAIFMWSIDTHLPQALDVFKAYGFEYKTVGFYWVKTNRDGTPFTGMGYWSRANPEQCMTNLSPEFVEEQYQAWLATKGAPKRKARDVKRLIMAPRREHSRKPDDIYERIEALVDGPYLELFSRNDRAGWTHWGKEAGKFSIGRTVSREDLLGELPAPKPKRAEPEDAADREPIHPAMKLPRRVLELIG